MISHIEKFCGTATCNIPHRRTSFSQCGILCEEKQFHPPRDSFMQGTHAHDDAVCIGVQPITGAHPYTLDAYCHIAQARAAFFRRQRHQSKGTYPDRSRMELRYIAHTTIDHDPSPTIARSRSRQVTADQGAAQGATSIDHEHAPQSRGFDRGFDQTVVLEALHRAHRPTKDRRSAINLKHRGQHAKSSTVITLVGITKITSAEGRASGRCHLEGIFHHLKFMVFVLRRDGRGGSTVPFFTQISACKGSAA